MSCPLPPSQTPSCYSKERSVDMLRKLVNIWSSAYGLHSMDDYLHHILQVCLVTVGSKHFTCDFMIQPNNWTSAPHLLLLLLRQTIPHVLLHLPPCHLLIPLSLPLSHLFSSPLLLPLMVPSLPSLPGILVDIFV